MTGTTRRQRDYHALSTAVLGAMISLAVAESARALDPLKSLGQYVHDVWQTREGLPQNSILAITQSRDGYLWLGTEEGLARFDGIQFTTFDMKNTPELPASFVRALCEDRDGCLWVGTSRGLARVRNGRIAPVREPGAPAGTYVVCILEDRTGAMWIGTDGSGVYRFKDGSIRDYTTSDGLTSDHVLSICEDRAGDLWIGTDGGGLNRLHAGMFTSYGTKDGLSSSIVRVVIQDARDSLWVGTPAGLDRLAAGRFTHYTTREGLLNNLVRTIWQDRDGNLWVGTLGGLSRIVDGTVTSYAVKDGLSNDAIFSINEDREGSLWVGTLSGGLNRFRDGKFLTYTTSEGLPNDVVRTICADRAGGIWFGTDGGGLTHFKDGKFETYTTKNGLVNDVVSSVCEDRAGDLWVGTTGGGLSRFDHKAFRTYTIHDGLSNNQIEAIYEDVGGRLWVGTRKGLNLFKDGVFCDFPGRAQLAEANVDAITETRQGDLWIGTFGRGLVRLRGEELTWYTKKNGLPDDFIQCLLEDSDGCLWISSWQGGLSRWKNEVISQCGSAPGPFKDEVFCLLEDDHGSIWMTGNRGISCARRADLDRAAEGGAAPLPFTTYGTADGMKDRECNGGNQPAGCKSPDGRLWIPTIKGIVVVDPSAIRSNELPPPVAVEQVVIDGRLFDPRERAQIPPGDGKLEFHYTGLSLLVPSRVRFKYKLENFDEDWVDAGTRRTAFYTNIPPGHYQFSVMACNNDGVWSVAPATFTFSLEAPFWRRLWFIGLAILCALALVHRMCRARQSIQNRREREKMEVVRSVTAGILHEFRQPLQAMQTRLELMQLRSEGKDDEAVEDAQRVLDSLERMRHLLERVESLHNGEELRLKPYATQDRIVDLGPPTKKP